MKVYALTVAERRSPWRTLRLAAPGATTLDELAGLLARELGLAAGRAASFFRSARVWDARTEFSSHGRSEHALQGVRLDRFALRPGATFLYLHDRDHPRWHELRVEAVEEADGPLRVLERLTPASRAEVPLASRLFDVLEIPEPDLSEKDRRARQASEIRTAEELLECGTEEIQRLGLDEGLDVEQWLLDLPRELAHEELAHGETSGEVIDQALALAARVGRALDDPAPLADRAVILAKTGRRSEAEAEVEEVLEHRAVRAVQVAVCGDVLRKLGDAARAEGLYRHALSIAATHADAELVRERLKNLLVAEGRATEARAFELALEDAMPGEPAAGPGALGGAADELVPVARVGRNDPCPCGSGKKFKRCCAREAGEVERGELEFLTPGLHRALEHTLASASAASVRSGIARFAGAAFEGLELKEALPLLPEEGAELAYLDWWLADREEAPGRTLLDGYLEKRAGKLDPREARVLRRLGTTTLGLYRLEMPDFRKGETNARLVDLLTARVHALPAAEVADSRGANQLLRVVDADGRARIVHEGIPLRAAHAVRLAAELRPRWSDLARAERSPALFRAWLDALHAPVM